jgi:predicted flavoprotein YhiN
LPSTKNTKASCFCDRSAEDIIAMLLAECAAGGVDTLATLWREKYTIFGLQPLWNVRKQL